MIKSDIELQGDVMHELAFEPQVEASHIGVGARDGVVTLTGTVSDFNEKLAAEHAVKRVSGVRGFVEHLAVEIPPSRRRGDAEIARDVVNALAGDITVPDDRITAKVEGGWLTLEGQVDWRYQREHAGRAVQHLPGIKGVSNMITVRPSAQAAEVAWRIRQAFTRRAEIDENTIEIESSGARVTLRGTVRSWAERDAATEVAYSVPGVTVVENLTEIV
ncbi:MAG TPA: BON domain-containing protein [Candidatus Dormibacteraeota bacterium]|nr:BON domain-containing protein [Candidatus Dormibacteraeota bacterium]